MKTKIKSLLMLLCVAVTMTSCYRVKPNADQESVLIYQPFLFGHGGVEDEAVSTGAMWCVVTTDHREFIITPVTYTEPFDNLITDDHINVDFNAYIKIQIKKGQSPKLYEGFGEKWYDNSIKETFRTSVRNKASAHNCFELASDRKKLDSLQMVIFNEMTKYVKDNGIPVEVQSVLIGAVTPPQPILDETVHTATANQRILTNNANELSEISRKKAEYAKADADKAYQEKMNMTVKEYLQLRTLEMLDKNKANVTWILGDALPYYQVK
jgi:regulator of protease activity HflC (stomatin/prohibitin superfamily)